MKRKRIRSGVIVGLTVMLAPLVTQAAIVYTNTSTITQLWAWAQTGSSADGDAIVLMDTGLTACPKGVWIPATNNPNKVYSAALVAYTSKKALKFSVYDNEFWSGSGTPYCKVYAIFLE